VKEKRLTEEGPPTMSVVVSTTEAPARARDELLKLMRQLRNERESIEKELAVAVMTARGLGASWTLIGDALGVSKQAALQRFGRR